ncbi:alpha/beta fold hydrolase [Streptacidiphilus sp. EB129]|uniref:alpha/beta fold hydrolase n=1 Tax=Streptacidiphilus sp. EB129 TaxID=3156262 RepID=UPI0035186319
MGPDISRRRVLATGAAVAGSAALLTPFGSTTAAAATNHGPAAGPATKPTVVLIHGGFADASCWNGTIELLQQHGYPTIAPANPLRSLPGDAAYINSVLRSIDGPIVLVGHSYGGAVITNAAADVDGVRALVYIAAFVARSSRYRAPPMSP